MGRKKGVADSDLRSAAPKSSKHKAIPICYRLRLSAYICGKNFTLDSHRKFFPSLNPKTFVRR
ncbi:hypothetical protein H6S82_26390 [Planktothrix sp. FACHB-1355]|uniref:hypothetical protein n=1 Tax=Oscillatoriophycideae TaxID=1301283 RepID=UPI001687DA67|nr:MULTISPECIES: hypothetical protein [Oscillatoriales]MBD3562340.1 hypothetical protein [Planktothrix sp. FACHB-1355]